VTEQPLDIRTTIRGLWRRRLLLGAIAAAGVAGGIAYGMMRPPRPHAVTLVLLPPSPVGSTGLPERDMKTQIVLAASDPVLAPAARAVSPPVAVTDLRREVSAKALSQQVLQVGVAAPRSSVAVTLANAVATSYVHYVTKILPPGAAGGPIEVLQPATSALPPSKLHIPIDAGMGLGAALLAGLVLALVLAGRDRRLRSRDEILRATGVPVLASLEVKPCRTVSQWRRLLDGSVPTPVVTWNVRRVLHRLAPADVEATREIRVMAFRDDKAAVAAGAELAVVAATLGVTTALVPGDDDVMVPLRAACAARGPSGRLAELHVLTSPSVLPRESGLSSDREEPEPGSDRPELVISLVVVDRSRPEVRPFGAVNVVTVSAGFATADDLARLALAAADAGQALDGIVVVNPEPDDGTTGSTGDGEVQSVVTRVSRPSGAEHTAGRSR
jgi:capsular polysaccharide biosynthesis protein